MFEHIFVAYFAACMIIGALGCLGDSVETEYGE